MAGSIHCNIPDSRGLNAYGADPAMAALLSVYLQPEMRALAEPQLDRMGALVGDELEGLALSADRNPPILSIRSRNGASVENITKHPDFRELERYAFSEFGLAAMSHRGGVFGAPEKLPPFVKYALVYLFVQSEFGLCCPLSMTDSLTRTLVKFGEPGLVARYFDQLTSQDMGELFQGAMFMTEQAAGSDVGAIDTTARLEDGNWKLFGDKWFCSNPDAALAMVLARPEGGDAGTRGLSLFLLPRHLPDGSRNAYSILRLKDKMGTKSMASGEIRLEGATAYLVGEAGQGFKQMTDMINMSRLANGVRSAGLMRRSVNEAIFIARNRTAFGRKLADLPLMQVQLAKMLTTAEQGRSMVFHASRVLQAADAGDARMAKVLRILTPLIKFRTCRDARKVAGDAMEVRGGCGYIEEWSDARVLRDSHLGSIWEGTSNIVALDVARATRREGALEALEGYLEEIGAEALGQGINEVRPALEVLARASRLLDDIARDPGREHETRRAVTAVYNASSAVIMCWEAGQMKLQGHNAADDRAALAAMVLAHKLTARDPLAGNDACPGVGDLLDRAFCDRGSLATRVAAE
ncbi:MAG: DNA alkylation response protein [Rhodobacteraceae bacterium]|nr:DNA alkylation response protein [Paracoccaceae bacterium]MBR9823586.1 DNA alkylation response protein [Paracoccaceae bacterium]